MCKSEAVDQCQFCRLSATGRSLYFDKLMNGKEEVLYRDDRFIIVPDVAPCRPGHMLVVASSHVTSLATRWTDGSLAILVQRISQALASLEETAVFFEHGVGSDRKAPSCVEHAHVHVIPCAQPIAGLLSAEVEGLVKVPRPTPPMNDEYAVLLDVDGSWYQSVTGPFAGQSIRRAVTPPSHGPYWNWMDFVHFPDPLRTRARIEEGAKTYSAVAKWLRTS